MDAWGRNTKTKMYIRRVRSVNGMTWHIMVCADITSLQCISTLTAGLRHSDPPPSTHCCEKPPFHSGRWPNFRSDSFKLQIRNPCLRQSSNLNNKLRQRRCVCVGHSGNYEHFAQHKQRNKTPSCWWSDGEQSHAEKLIVCCTRIIRKFKVFPGI